MSLSLESGVSHLETSEHPIATLISEAVQDPSWKDPEAGHFTVPFYKPIDGVFYDLWFRRRHFYPNGPEFAIDLGVFEGADFDSVASVDFSIRDTLDSIATRGVEKPRIGVVQRSIPMLWTDGIRCNRNRDRNDFEKGIYVKHKEDVVDLRGKKIGKALVSAARVVLANEGVRQLIFDEITDLSEGSQTGEFYRRLGGRIFTLDKRHEDPTPKVSIPTVSSLKYPYRFE